MLAYTYIEKGRFELLEKAKPELLDDRDAIVKVTLSSSAAAIYISNTVPCRERYLESR